MKETRAWPRAVIVATSVAVAVVAAALVVGDPNWTLVIAIISSVTIGSGILPLLRRTR